MPRDAEHFAKRESPYVGLAPFGEEDAEFFFGRDRERNLVISNLRSSRLTIFYGESGVGKSSLLNAGVVHQLRDVAERNRQASGLPGFAVVVFRDWQVDPLRGLLEEAKRAVDRTLGIHHGDSGSDSSSLADALRVCAEHAGGKLLVILDQFEEFFRYHPDKTGEEFAEEFAGAVNTPGLRANFLISIREDALAKLDRFKGRIPSLLSNTLRIRHLDHKDGTARALACDRANGLFHGRRTRPTVRGRSRSAARSPQHQSHPNCDKQCAF